MKLWVLFIFGYSWNLSSSSMIVLFGLVLAASLLYYRQKINTHQVIRVGVIFLLGSLLGLAIGGGMFLPAKLGDRLQVPGLMKVQNDQFPAFQMRFPRTSEGNPHTYSRLLALRDSLTGTKTDPSPQDQDKFFSARSAFQENNFTLALVKLGRSLQLVFFPLAGLWLAMRTKKRDLPYTRSFDFPSFFLSASFLLFFVGWVISTCFSLYGYYWELSKFFYFGSFAGMFWLGIAVTKWWSAQQTTLRRWLLTILISFIILGPSLQFFVVDLWGNFVLPCQTDENLGEAGQHCLSVSERLDKLITDQTIFGSIN